MLDELEDVSDALNMKFVYGLLGDLETMAQDHESGYMLFHEGYFLADLNEDAQGAVEFRHRLTLYVLTPSLLTDSRQTKRTHLADLKQEMLTVYARLRKLGQASGVRVEMGLNLTTRQLDTIKLTLTVLTEPVSICRL